MNYKLVTLIFLSLYLFGCENLVIEQPNSKNFKLEKKI